VSPPVERAALISGIGMSQVGRRLHLDPWALTADAALDAIADAGLTPDDIDGVATYPGALWSTPGITGAGVDDVRSMLGLRLRWYTGGGEVPGQLGSIANAVLAVGAGLADHVLCFRTVWESTAQDDMGGRSSALTSGKALKYGRETDQWNAPYGMGYPSYAAMIMQRRFELDGGSREQIAQVALTARAHAALNPAAVYREPMSMDDYLASRMISDPLCLYDCDVPVDGSVAVVVSRADSPAIDRTRAVGIEAMGTASGFEACGRMLWERTDLTPADVDVAQLYDGFTIIAVQWLEALGFCGPGEGLAFVEGGTRISLDGELPLNTGGGQLSGGRLHGYGYLHEACVQLRGLGGDRQVDPLPRVAAVSSGAENFTSALLLTAPSGSSR
jgi:acetyl-CoA acetyltransferase